MKKNSPRAVEDLRVHKVKIGCCTYHRQRDAQEISEYLKGIGFGIRYSEGCMLPPLEGIEAPYFRKAMLYARNC